MLAPLTPASAVALLSPSARVLAAASAPDRGVARAGALPWGDVDWTTLVGLAAYERAESAVHRVASAAGERVPEAVQKALTGQHRVAMFRAAELAEAAAAAQLALGGAGVRALWLKGAALAMQHPDGFGVRGMGDLDVMVDPAELDRAAAALVGAGFRRVEAAGYDAHHHEAPFEWRGGLRLELHRGLFTPGHPFADEPAATWLARAVRHTWSGQEVLVLPPHWHVVHASVHWTWGHEGEVGSWQYLHDMHQLAAGHGALPGFWDFVVESARAIGAPVPVGWGLWSAALLGGVPVPEAVWRGLRGRPSAVGMAERQWVVRAFQSPAASPSVRWTRFWWRRAMQGLGDAGRQWPWALGRAGAVVAAPVVPASSERASSGLVSRGGPGTGRWRDHLLRVLRS